LYLPFFFCTCAPPLQTPREDNAMLFAHAGHCHTAFSDSGFLHQIWKILADLKVVWQAKNSSGGLPISGGFLADLTNFAWVCFCLADFGGFGVSVRKKPFFSHFFFQIKNCSEQIFLCKIFSKKNKYFQKI
jgi:hypothetical protein